MKPSGKINPVTVLMLLAFGAAGYWVVFIGSAHYDNMQVREAVDAAFNAFPVDGEARAFSGLMTRLNLPSQYGTIGEHFEVDEDGVETVVPGLGVTEDDITIEYNELTKTLTVRVQYQRVIELKPTKRRKTLSFVVEKSGVIK